MRGVITSIFALQHRMNPLHLYCRCMERGYRRGVSFFYCRAYEVTVFFFVRKILRGMLMLSDACDGEDRATGPRLRRAVEREAKRRSP
jgi:hypothetical protein